MNTTVLGFPGGASGKEPACQRSGLGFDAWSGKIPHATGQLRPGAVAQSPGREAALAWARLAQLFPASSVLAREGAGCAGAAGDPWVSQEDPLE